jgi:hypothetical protein
MTILRLLFPFLASLSLTSVAWAQAAPTAPGPTAQPPGATPPPQAAPPPQPPPAYPPPAYPPPNYPPPQQVPPGYGPPPYPAPMAPPEPPPEHDVSLTFSPLHLFLPVLEVTGEFRIHKIMGIAAIGGIGSISIENAGPDVPSHAAVYELGGQYRVYPIGSFEHGMQLGVEALYLHVSVENATVSGFGSGLALGPFVGYKIITSVGFTFDAQLGVEFLAVKAQVQDNGGQTASATDKATIPLLNLNIGWSF